MDERVHPSHNEATNPTPPPNQTQPPPSSSEPGDYVIKVPRDQVLREPPPENQRLFERKTMRKNNSGHRRCCCCFLGILLVLLVALAATAGILYLIFRPKAPNYTLDSLSIRGLNVSSPSFNASSLSPAIDAVITADNPNKRIGFYYRDGSSIHVFFSGSVQTPLCSGAWPVFYHGKSNETVIRVGLKGEEVLLTEAIGSEMKKGESNRRVPLKVNVDVPVKIKFGLLKLWKMTVKVRCSVVVNELSPEAKIVSNDCGHKFDVI